MKGTGRRSDDDRGVVLVLVAVAMIAILIITAMVVDLGAKNPLIAGAIKRLQTRLTRGGLVLGGEQRANGRLEPLSRMQGRRVLRSPMWNR